MARAGVGVAQITKPFNWMGVRVLIFGVVSAWVVGAVIAMLVVVLRWMFSLEMGETSKIGWKYTLFIIGPFAVAAYIWGMGLSMEAT